MIHCLHFYVYVYIKLLTILFSILNPPLRSRNWRNSISIQLMKSFLLHFGISSIASAAVCGSILRPEVIIIFAVAVVIVVDWVFDSQLDRLGGSEWMSESWPSGQIFAGCVSAVNDLRAAFGYCSSRSESCRIILVIMARAILRPDGHSARICIGLLRLMH